jgi:putative transposase
LKLAEISTHLESREKLKYLMRRGLRFDVRSGSRKGPEHKRSRLSEEQTTGILKKHEAGVSVADPCRKNGVSDASIYKATFDDTEVSDARRLKRLLADAMLDDVALKDLLGTK